MAQVKEKVVAPTGASEPKRNGVNGLVNGYTVNGYGDTANGHGRAAADRVCEMASAYAGDRLDGEARDAFEQHLLGCASCRDTVREQLEKLPVGKAVRARLYMEKVDEWVLLNSAIQSAAESARAEMRAKGLRFIYEQDGVLVEELADGTIRPGGERPNVLAN